MAWTAIRGQPLALQMLQAHLQQGCVAPSYLFVGPEGVGKRLVAFELAKALNCECGTSDPCDQCGQCQRIARRVHPDLHELIPQGPSESIKMDQVRELLGRTALRPYMGRSCVVIIDGAERLGEEAANSLLKILEEPPCQTRFILITAKPFDCLPTIVSRCRVIHFQRLSVSVVEDLLMQVEDCDPQTAHTVSRLAQGSSSRAIELAGRWTTYRAILTQMAGGEPRRWLEWTIPSDRKELAWWLAGAVSWLRDVAIASVADETLILHQESVVSIRRQSQQWDRDRCMGVAMQCIALWDSLEQFVSPRLVGTLLREQWLELLQGKAPW